MRAARCTPRRATSTTAVTGCPRRAHGTARRTKPRQRCSVVRPIRPHDLATTPKGWLLPCRKASAVSGSRTALLNHADEVDRGELSVSDMWVVLIKPVRVSAEKAASLQAQAK